jgi:hypothetical protein
MVFADRLGLAALIVALIGIATIYLWPTKKWIGYAALVLAVVLGFVWGGLEIKEHWHEAKSIVEKFGGGWGVSFTFALIAVILAFLLYGTRRKQVSLAQETSRLRDEINHLKDEIRNLQVAHTGRAEFYSRRSALPHGSLNEELRKSGECFWALWQAGHQVPVLEEHICRKIEHTILGDPNQPDDVMQRWAEAADAGSADVVRQRITEAARKLKASGKDVKWTTEKSLSLIIANPEHRDGSGYIRIECIIPFLLPTLRPSVSFKECDYPQLFDSIVQAYKKIWKASSDSDGS